MTRMNALMALLLAGMLLGYGCGGGDGAVTDNSGGGGPPGGQTSIQGDVWAPAAQGGSLVPSTNVTVELVEVDSEGIQVGSVVTTVDTDANGRFDMDLPAGMQVSTQVVVQVWIGGTVMRACVTTEQVVIDPLSEYVFRGLTADGTKLEDVTVEEVQMLRDFCGSGGHRIEVTIELTIESIDDAVGEDAESLIKRIQGPTGPGLTWGEYSIASVSADVQTTASTAAWSDYGVATMVGTAPGLGIVSQTWQSEQVFSLDSQANGSGGLRYSWRPEASVRNEATAIPVVTFQDGSLCLAVPGEEEIETWSGYRVKPSVRWAFPLSSAPGNAMFAMSTSRTEEHYELAPGGTTLDLTKPLGRHVDFGLTFVGRQEPVDNAALDGHTYGMANLGFWSSESGMRYVYSDLNALTFQANGATRGTVSLWVSELSLTRVPHATNLAADVIWSDTGQSTDDPVPYEEDEGTGSYQLDPTTGLLTFDFVTTDLYTFVCSDGDFMAHSWTDTNGTPSTEGEVDAGLMVRLGNANPSIEGNSYRVLLLQAGFDSNGGSWISRTLNGTATISGGFMSFTGVAHDIWRANDGAGPIDEETEVLSRQGAYAWTGSNGRVSITMPDAKLDGYMNHDGSVGVLRLAHSELASFSEASLGLVVLIEK